jgi:aryl carrier-like protein
MSRTNWRWNSMAGLASPAATAAFAESWCAVLAVPQARPADNFFDLGGDSIAGLRMIAKLREHGFALQLQQLYENPEFGDIAALVGPVSAGPEVTAAAGREVRRLPLLPVQVRTLEYDRVNPHHHNDDTVYSVPAGVTAAALTSALTALTEAHPVLGSRFCLEPGREYQEVGGPVDLRRAIAVAEAEPGDKALVTEIGTRAHRALDLTAGQVFAARILTWRGEPWALLMVIHHLVCDAISWEFLAADLARLLAGERVLPGSGSYASWVDFLVSQSAGSAFDEHLAYWRSRPWSEVTGLGLRVTDADRTMADVRIVRSAADIGDGLAFRRATLAHGGEAVILGALNYALGKERGTPATLVDVVVNGRDKIAGAPDISRTVGWFAEFMPVVTELGATRDALGVIEATARQLRAMPAPRIAFGCLRQLGPEPSIRREFQELPKAEVYLNYRGALLTRNSGPLPELDYWLGPFQSQEEQQPYPLKIMCDLEGDNVVAQWKYSPAELGRAEVEAVAEAFSSALRELAGN